MKILRIALTVVSLLLAFFIYRGIKKPIDFAKEKKYRYDFVIARLKEIRDSQLAYKSEKGTYAKDFESLTDFLRNGKFTLVKQIGNPEDSNAVVIRDTVYVNVKDSLFPGALWKIDSLPYVPFGEGAKFKMDAGQIEKGKVMVNVFEVIDTKPFDPNQVLKVGSMTEPSNAGNWE